MNREEIQNIIPHRDAMLLLDEVFLDGETAKGVYRVRGDEWFLQGHFPGNPIVPGVIQCEIAGQASCVLFEGMEGKTPMFTGMNNVKFKNPVRPGDVITAECVKKREVGAFKFIEAKLFAGEKLCMSGEFSFALV